MSDQDTGATTQPLTVGGVLGRTMSIVGKNFPVLLGVTVLFYLPSLVVGVVQVNALSSGQMDLAVWSGLGNIIAAVFQFALVGGITYAVYKALQGGQASFGETIGKGFRFLGPVFAVSILSTIAVFVGLILLIVPGIIAMIMLSVAIPALVAERTGIFESLSRSADLTKGYRWSILGIFLVWLVIVAVLLFVGGGLVGAITYGMGTMAAVISNWVFTVLYGMVGAVLAPVIYFELRIAKEGLDLGQIASVFD